MTTTTVTPQASADPRVSAIRDVTIGDLHMAAAHTAALIGASASPADIYAAASREMDLADMHVAGHGEADLDAAAADWQAAYESGEAAHEPEAGA